MELRLIVSDLDGTLLTDDKKISPYTRDMLAEAVRRGVCFVPATGRAFDTIPQEVLELPGVRYVIASNGAAVYELSPCPGSTDDEVRSGLMRGVSIPQGQIAGQGADGSVCTSVRDSACAPISDSDRASADGSVCAQADARKGRRIYSCLLDPASVDAMLALERDGRITYEVLVAGVPYTEKRYVADPAAFGATEFGVRYIRQTRLGIDGLEEFARAHREELDAVDFVCADRVVREAFLARLRREVPSVSITSSIPNLIEVGSERADKGQTLLWLLRHLGIPASQVMTFGDADNDLAMISGVTYGVAMGNASEACRRAAWAVTSTNQEDGVGRMVGRALARNLL